MGIQVPEPPDKVHLRQEIEASRPPGGDPPAQISISRSVNGDNQTFKRAIDMTDNELAAIASGATLHVVGSPSVSAEACLRQGSFALGNRGIATTGGDPLQRSAEVIGMVGTMDR